MAHKPNVLFLCIHNAGRSQTAAANLIHLAGDNVKVHSAGSAPSVLPKPNRVQVMLEEGINISERNRRCLGAKPFRNVMLLLRWGVGMSVCFSRERDMLKEIEVMRGIRNEILGRVEGLIEELRVS